MRVKKRVKPAGGILLQVADRRCRGRKRHRTLWKVLSDPGEKPKERTFWDHKRRREVREKSLRQEENKKWGVPREETARLELGLTDGQDKR